MGEQDDDEPGHPIAESNVLVAEEPSGDLGQPGRLAPGRRLGLLGRHLETSTAPPQDGPRDEVPGHERVGGGGEPLVDVALTSLCQRQPPVGQKAQESHRRVGLVACAAGQGRCQPPGLGADGQGAHVAPGQVGRDLAAGGRVGDGGEPALAPDGEGGQVLIALG